MLVRNVTSILCINKTKFEALYRKEGVMADQNMVESETEQIYDPAKTGNMAMLVVSDLVCATMHKNMVLRAKEFGVMVELMHNASTMGAAGCSCTALARQCQSPILTTTGVPQTSTPRSSTATAGMHTILWRS